MLDSFGVAAAPLETLNMIYIGLFSKHQTICFKAPNTQLHLLSRKQWLGRKKM